jgi:hypothetical protein
MAVRDVAPEITAIKRDVIEIQETQPEPRHDEQMPQLEREAIAQLDREFLQVRFILFGYL